MTDPLTALDTGQTAPAGSSSGCLTPPVRLPDHLVGMIHDRVLQSIAVSMLQAELGQHLLRTGETEAAVAELDGILGGLAAAAADLRHVLHDLKQATGSTFVSDVSHADARRSHD